MMSCYFVKATNSTMGSIIELLPIFSQNFIIP